MTALLRFCKVKMFVLIASSCFSQAIIKQGELVFINSNQLSINQNMWLDTLESEVLQRNTIDVLTKVNEAHEAQIKDLNFIIAKHESKDKLEQKRLDKLSDGFRQLSDQNYKLSNKVAKYNLMTIAGIGLGVGVILSK